MEVHVFPDRGTFHDPLLQRVVGQFDVHAHLVPDNEWYGNTPNTMGAFLWAYNTGFDRVFYVESDVMVHEDFFSWHRQQQEMFDDIFASMAWIFNRHAPITDDLLFQPWYYAIGTCFSKQKLALLAEHASPKYYSHMDEYIASSFPDSKLNGPILIEHTEQDGLIQRILERDRSQTVSPGIAKCSHVGFTRSYGSPNTRRDYNEILGNGSFEDRVKCAEGFISDYWWRANIFGRPIVEREIGHALEKREYRYRITVPGGWESEFKSELTRERLPKRINSVTLPPDSVVTLAD
jgi:hypothetical protein